MITKRLIIILSLMVLLTSNCLAEKLFDKDFTRQVAIDKFFTGRVMDPIEGIWYMDKKAEFAIVQKSLVPLAKVQKGKDRYADCNYIVIKINDGSIYFGLKKTDIPHLYDGIEGTKAVVEDCEWRLLAPRTLQIGGPVTIPEQWRLRDSGLRNDFIMQIYPAPSL